jgi:hypothetical protein
MGRKPAETEITQLGKKSTITIEELGQAESCDLGPGTLLCNFADWALIPSLLRWVMIDDPGWLLWMGDYVYLRYASEYDICDDWIVFDIYIEIICSVSGISFLLRGCG